MNNKLDIFRGELTPLQVAEGMNAATDNALRLVQDAKILFESGRFPTATSLAILAIEEAGKVSVLRGIALARDQSEFKEAWKDYRSHTKKNTTWLLPELVSKGARKLDDFAPLFDPCSDHPYLLDHLKQIGFYTDCLGKAHWSIPEDVIDKRTASSIIQLSELMVKHRKVTPLEIELWIKHLKPVWKKDNSWMKQALINWSQEMSEKGLVNEREDKMEQFIREGLDFD